MKDVTSDMAISATKGSRQVRAFREQQEKKNAQEKHWELAGTSIGDIMGIKVKSEDSAEADGAKDFRYQN